MAKQHQGKKIQVCYTPPEFIIPCRRVFTKSGQFSYDFAASEPNICENFFTEEMDSLSFSWWDLFVGHEHIDPGWLNPPFTFSSKFLKKASDESALGADVLCLVQFAAGCSYWHTNNLVWGNPLARLIVPEGRIGFIEPLNDEYKNEKTGKSNGSKNDCALIRYSLENLDLPAEERLMIWDWRNPEADPVPAWKYH